MSIDLDRGCIKRQHTSGMEVVMYTDAPGVYYDGAGVLTTDVVAASAGFDISTLARDRERNSRLIDYRAKVDEEFEVFENKLARLASDGVENAEIQPVGKGVYAIFRDNERITPFSMSISEAEDLLRNLAPGASEDDEDAGKSTDDETETAKDSENASGGSGSKTAEYLI